MQVCARVCVRCLCFSVFDCLLLICICVLVSCVCVCVWSLRCFCCCCCRWLNPFFTLADMNECGTHTHKHTHRHTHTHTLIHWGILIPFGVLCIDPSNSPTCCQRQRLLPSSVYYYSCCCCCLVCVRVCVFVYWLLCQLFGGFCLPVNPPNNLPLPTLFTPSPLLPLPYPRWLPGNFVNYKSFAFGSMLMSLPGTTPTSSAILLPMSRMTTMCVCTCMCVCVCVCLFLHNLRNFLQFWQLCYAPGPLSR